jgi:DNA-binding transcriptional LysR family regulator
VDLNRVHPILLQTFLAVAEAGQISEAARRLHLSQQAVTGQIRRLEAVVERALEEGGANPRKLDQRFELGSSEAIKSLVIAGLGIGFFSSWEIQQEIALKRSGSVNSEASLSIQIVLEVNSAGYQLRRVSLGLNR